MSALPKKNGSLSAYRDQQFQGTLKEQEEKLRGSTTLYVGNLSFFTTEDQIHHLFSKSGDVKRTIIGLDRFSKTPCGFCFVEYYTRRDGEDALRYVNGTRLDERIIRCDWDAGFVEGRQYGRGKSGGQVRDEFRTDYDGGRGGFGKMIQNRMERVTASGFPAEGGPGQRRSFGKRKWQEQQDSESQGEEIDRTTDLRVKLRKIRGENGEEVSSAEQDFSVGTDKASDEDGGSDQNRIEQKPEQDSESRTNINQQSIDASENLRTNTSEMPVTEEHMAETAALSEQSGEANVICELAGEIADLDKKMDWS